MGHSFQLKQAAYTSFHTDIEDEHRFIGLDMNPYKMSLEKTSIHTWVKDVKMSASKYIYNSDFISIESTLNISKASTFNVSN